MAATSTPAGISPEPRGRIGSRNRRIARWCIALIAVFSVASLIGTAASLSLANNYPLTLVALSPLSRHLLLVAPAVDPLSFLLVGTVRSVALFVTSYYLGRALGPAGIRWMQSRAPRAVGFVRWCENLFNKAPATAVVLLASPVLGIIAGIAGMKVVTFTSLSCVAMILRLVLVLELGDWLRGPIDSLRMLVGEYWLPGTIVIVALIGLNQWRKRRRAARAV